MKTITKHYIDGTFVESHGREVMESINPARGVRDYAGDRRTMAIRASGRRFAERNNNGN